MYGEGQLYMYGPNLISQNGSSGNPRSAGVVVEETPKRICGAERSPQTRARAS